MPKRKATWKPSVSSGSSKRPKPAEKKSERAVSESNRPKSYKQWSEESMLGALRATAEGMGINRAATEFGVPKSTLKDRVAGRVQHGCKSGKVPYLTSSEEQELYDYLVTCSKIGYPKRRDDVIGIVRKTLQNKKNDLETIKFNGKGWWLRFMQRWPQLALRKGDALAQPRACAVSKQNECSVCLGLYEDDLVDGVLVNEWIRCTNVSCGLWMHCGWKLL